MEKNKESFPIKNINNDPNPLKYIKVLNLKIKPNF